MWLSSLFVDFTTKSAILRILTSYGVWYVIYNAIYSV